MSLSSAAAEVDTGKGAPDLKLSWQEVEILEQLSRGPASAPRIDSAGALASHWMAKDYSEQEFAEALDSLRARGFVEIGSNGKLLITEKGNAALASL